MDLKRCRVCRSFDLLKVCSFPDVPLAGDFKDDINQVDIYYPLVLLFCLECKVLQIEKAVDQERLFNTYFFSTSTVPSLVTHFNEFAYWIVDRYKPKTVLEVGCNDGLLLDGLKKLGVETFGVDMAANIVNLALEKNLNIKNTKFCKENISDFLDWLPKIDIITTSNTFPHNDDPNGFLSTVKTLLKSNGRIILEVMYAGSLREKLQWDTLYHEHLHVHSLTSLEYLLNRNGFSIEDAEILDMHAGTLRVVAVSGDKPSSVRVKEIIRSEKITNLNTIESWKKFGIDSLKSIEDCKNFLYDLDRTKKIWAYGASGRSTMWLNAAKLFFVEKIVDASFLRIGRFVPGISIPVVGPAEFDLYQPDYTLITAWNYSQQIISQHTNYQGKWIVPLPTFKIVEGSK